MKKRLPILLLLSSLFAMSGCDFIQITDSKNSSNNNSNTQQNSGNTNSGNNEGNNQGNNTTGGQTTGGEETGTLLDILKSKARVIGSKVLNKSESAITFGDFESESADADVYYYDSSSLTFVDIETYVESFDTSLADSLKAYLPSGVTLVENNDYLELLEEYGAAWYDRIYSDGTYSYGIYVEAYDEMSDDEESYPAETYGCIYIYKTSQQSAFDAYFSEE